MLKQWASQITTDLLVWSSLFFGFYLQLEFAKNVNVAGIALIVIWSIIVLSVITIFQWTAINANVNKAMRDKTFHGDMIKVIRLQDKNPANNPIYVYALVSTTVEALIMAALGYYWTAGLYGSFGVAAIQTIHEAQTIGLEEVK
jgi:hypothetical protein